MERTGPGEEGVFRGVAVSVFGDEVGWGCGEGGGIAELKLLGGGKSEAQGGLGSGDVEVLDVDGLVGFGKGERGGWTGPAWSSRWCLFAGGGKR